MLVVLQVNIGSLNLRRYFMDSKIQEEENQNAQNSKKDDFEIFELAVTERTVLQHDQ